MFTRRRRTGRKHEARGKFGERAEAVICYGFQEEEKTDVGVRMLNPQARLQAARWEKNNAVQIARFHLARAHV